MEFGLDKFPQRERRAAASVKARVTAIVIARAAGGTGRSPFELCLRSALAEPMIDELVIVDHGCTPAMSSAFRALKADRRDVEIVTVDWDTSAAAAANAGAECAQGRWLLFLDPNVVLQRGAVDRLVAAADSARAPWIVGGRLTDPHGRERRAARTGALTPWSALALALGWRGARPKARRDEAASVAAVSNAFMLMQRADFDALGGFDARFATDAADIDLCHRVHATGGAVLFQPSASGVQFAHGNVRRKRAQGLALFAAKSARTPLQRAFALVAPGALSAILWLRDFVAGRPPLRP